MMRIHRRSPVVIWIALCVLTVISVVQVAEGWSTGFATVAVMAIAAVKAQLVIHHYMEAKRARLLWRVLYAAWSVVAAATIICGILFERTAAS